MMYCTADLNGRRVYVELTQRELYTDNARIIAFFEDRGEVMMVETTVGELNNIVGES